MKILFPKDSRKEIYSDAINNNAPKDFFYGSISSPDFDIDNSVINTRPSKSDLNISILNRIINKYFNLNFSKKKAEFLFKSIPLNSSITKILVPFFNEIEEANVSSSFTKSHVYLSYL